MTATVISNTPPFGAMTNQAVADLYALNLTITRLQAAVASASANYSPPGVVGTEFEGNATNFGVVANGTPGAKGADFQFAVGTLAAAWSAFWAASSGAIQSLDNGAPSP